MLHKLLSGKKKKKKKKRGGILMINMCIVLEKHKQNVPDEVQVFGQCSQKYSLIFAWFCVEPGDRLSDLCRLLPIQDNP